MTDTLNLDEITPAPVEGGVPNWRESSGETGERPRMSIPVPGGEKVQRPGIFSGRRKSPVAEPKLKRDRPVPDKLGPRHRESLENFYKMIGASIRPFDEFTGDVIIEQAPACAKSVYELAQENDAFRRFIIQLTTTSITAKVVMAHLPILLALSRHSKNDKVRMTAATTMVALKFQSQEETEQLFESKETDAPDAV